MSNLALVVETPTPAASKPLAEVDSLPGPVLPSGGSAEQVGWTLAALTVCFWGFRLWTAATMYSLFSLAAPVLILGGLVGVVGAWTARGRVRSALQGGLAGMWLIGFAGYCLMSLVSNPGYGTDALAFNQQAASALLHGVDPYSVSLAGALNHFMVPDTYHTWLLNGHELDLLSYPALSFLIYVPALALGAGMQAAAVVNFAAWAITILLLWRLLPSALRWAAPVIGTFTLYVFLAVGGVTDMVFLPFLVLACWRWDRYGDPAERGPARWIGPVALGLAMSVKQTPWFVLPFLLIGLGFEASARDQRRWWGVPLRYLGAVIGTFLAVNAPFFLWSPSHFLRGMLVPFLEPTVPAGQGLVSLALFHHLGGDLADFTLAGLAAVPVALLGFAAGYRVTRYALIPLAGIVFFWATRSYESYLIDLLPALLVAATTIRPAPSGRGAAPWRPKLLWALGGAAAAFGIIVAIALSSPQPLKLTIVGMQSTGQQDSVREVTVRVQNSTAAPARPVYSVMAGQYLSRAWRQVQGPATIPPHGSGLVTLEAPDVAAMPSLQGGWLLTAFQTSPASVSTSSVMQGSTDRLTFTPSSIEAPVPVGHTIHVEVQLRDRLGSPERRGGVVVALGQVVYQEQGDLAGETQINGAQLGQSPVTSTTDSSGIAHFSVRAGQALPAPVFFQAWIWPRNGVPHSYSQQLAVQFVNNDHPHT